MCAAQFSVYPVHIWNAGGKKRRSNERLNKIPAGDKRRENLNTFSIMSRRTRRRIFFYSTPFFLCVYKRWPSISIDELPPYMVSTLFLEKSTLLPTRFQQEANKRDYTRLAVY